MTVTERSYTVELEDAALPRGVLAEVRDGEVVYEVIDTPKRYYLMPVLLAVVGATYSSISIWAGVAGVLLGAAAGVVVAVYLSNRRKAYLLQRLRDGERELDAERVLKKNKIERVELGDDGDTVVVSASTGDVEFRGDPEDVDLLYQALL